MTEVYYLAVLVAVSEYLHHGKPGSNNQLKVLNQLCKASQGNTTAQTFTKVDAT